MLIAIGHFRIRFIERFGGTLTETSIEWLALGEGDALRQTEVQIYETTVVTVRQYVWNIAETFWETVPRRTKPEDFTDQFLEMLDYLLSRENVNADAASEVIQFGAERLKRTSGQGDT